MALQDLWDNYNDLLDDVELLDDTNIGGPTALNLDHLLALLNEYGRTVDAALETRFNDEITSATTKLTNTQAATNPSNPLDWIDLPDMLWEIYNFQTMGYTVVGDNLNVHYITTGEECPDFTGLSEPTRYDWAAETRVVFRLYLDGDLVPGFWSLVGDTSVWEQLYLALEG